MTAPQVQLDSEALLRVVRTALAPALKRRETIDILLQRWDLHCDSLSDGDLSQEQVDLVLTLAGLSDVLAALARMGTDD